MYKKIKVTADCKCNKCGDIFKVNSDSHIVCRDNCCKVKVDEYGSSYYTGNGMSKCYEIIEDSRIIVYDEDYYIKPTDEMLNIIKELKVAVGTYLYESIDKGTDKKEYLDHIELEFQSDLNSKYECNTFISTISFTKNNDDNNEEEILKKLHKVLDLYNKHRSGEFDISTKNRKALKEEFDWERKQLESYDYTFYIE